MKILLLIAAVAASFPFDSETRDSGIGGLVPPAHDWNVDPTHSSVVFKVKHAGASWFYGTFAKVEGSFTLDPKKPADGNVKITIDAESIDTRDEKRDQHVRGPDFFDAKQFPDITFTSAGIAKAGDAFVVSGELSMHGETKALKLRVEKTGEGEFHGKRIGYETSFTLKRSDFGMTYGLAEKVLGDEVTLMIAIEGVQNEGK